MAAKLGLPLHCRLGRRDDAGDDLKAAVEGGDQEQIEKFSKRTVKVTKQHNDECKHLLTLMGVPYVEVGICFLTGWCHVLALNGT